MVFSFLIPSNWHTSSWDGRAGWYPGLTIGLLAPQTGELSLPPGVVQCGWTSDLVLGTLVATLWTRLSHIGSHADNLKWSGNGGVVSALSLLCWQWSTLASSWSRRGYQHTCPPTTCVGPRSCTIGSLRNYQPCDHRDSLPTSVCSELLGYNSPLLVSLFRVEVVQYVIHQGEQVALTGYRTVGYPPWGMNDFGNAAVFPLIFAKGTDAPWSSESRIQAQELLYGWSVVDSWCDGSDWGHLRVGIL